MVTRRDLLSIGFTMVAATLLRGGGNPGERSAQVGYRKM